MSQPVGWESLKCPCGGDKLIKVVRLKYHKGGGHAEEPVGWRCTACHEDVDLGEMVRLAALRQKKAELDALREEISEEVKPNAAKPASKIPGQANV